MRGFRPSYFQARCEDVTEELERTKQENMQRYIDRVREGLPIFEDEQSGDPGVVRITYY